MLKKILVLAFAFQLILNISRPAFPLYANQMGASTFIIGLLTAAYAVLPLVFAISAGKIADKIGDRLPIIFGMTGLGMGMLLPWIWPSLTTLFISQLLTGLGSVFAAVSLQNVLGNASPPDRRDAYYSYFSTVNSLASVVGPLASGYLIQHVSYNAVFVAGMLTYLISMGFTRKLPNIKQAGRSEKVRFVDSIGLLKVVPLRKALIGNALSLYSRDIFLAYFPLFALQRDIPVDVSGWILALQGFAMVIIRFLLPKLYRFGFQTVLNASIIIGGVSFVGIAISESVFWLCFWSILLGFGLGCGQPISMTVAYNSSPKSRTGEVLGLRLAMNRISQLSAPMFFGLLGSSLGLVSIFYASGFMLLGGAWMIRTERHAPPSNETDGEEDTANENVTKYNP
ncbi:MFS transporter [Paenibacillus illinoisensis]|uniref:MFS transporter n=1 Tax=Paenibacillus illinoisensis TaxID=59845 RepID=UPI003D2E789E